MYSWRLRTLLFTLSSRLALTYYGVISAGESFDVVQTQDIQSFEYLPASSEPAEVIVEVIFERDFSIPEPTILTASWQPAASFESLEKAEFIDYEGWYGRKSYHFLQLSGESLRARTLYIAVYSNVTYSLTAAQYHISIIAQNSPLCPNNCFDNGRCQSGLCICNEGYAQPTCDTPMIGLQKKQTVVVEDSQVVYFYVLMDDMRKNKVVFEWTSGYPEILIKEGLCAYRTVLPSIYEFKSFFLADLAQGTYIVSNEDSFCNNSDFWMFRLGQNKARSAELIILTARLDSSSPSSSPNVMLVVVVLVGTLVAIAWSAFFAYKLRSCAMRRKLKVAAETSASLERMRRMCPKKDYKALPKAFTEQPCPICLEEFQVESEVRILPCQHAYHSKCIDQWFLNNSICCFCKIDIFKETEQKLMLEPSDQTETHLNETSQDVHLHVVELA